MNTFSGNRAAAVTCRALSDVSITQPYALRSSPHDEGVSLVTRDVGFYQELKAHLDQIRLSTTVFDDTPALLSSLTNHTTACVILDLDEQGLCEDSMQDLLTAKEMPPMILVASDVDVRASVRAVKAGAHDFFPKRFEMSSMLDSIRTALAFNRRLRSKRKEQQDLKIRYALLTPREREVLPLVVGGLLNKQAASILGISEITLQIHRGQVMRKMQAGSLAELVRISMTLRLPYWRPPCEEFRDGDHRTAPVAHRDLIVARSQTQVIYA